MRNQSRYNISSPQKYQSPVNTNHKRREHQNRIHSRHVHQSIKQNRQSETNPLTVLHGKISLQISAPEIFFSEADWKKQKHRNNPSRKNFLVGIHARNILRVVRNNSKRIEHIPSCEENKIKQHGTSNSDGNFFQVKKFFLKLVFEIYVRNH